MKLRWMLDSMPQGSLATLPSTMTMRAPMSLTERCHFKGKLGKKKKKSKSGPVTVEQLKPTASGQNIKSFGFNYL